MEIVIRPLATPTPRKLAEAELAFDAADGLLDGLLLRGIGIWESSERPGDVTVSLPTRHFRGRDGVQRTYPLLRSQRRCRDATRLLCAHIAAKYLMTLGLPSPSDTQSHTAATSARPVTRREE